jgi:hypothetical protein
MSRVFIFWVQMAWLVFLGALAALFFSKQDIITFPASGSLGPVPLGVIWFGALGAVLISLTGIVEHAHDWDESFALWHLSRPLVGASLAVVGVLIVKSGVLAAGQTPTNPTNAVGSTANAVAAIPKDLIFYYLVAFLVGYREETFRELIKRLVDLILTPGTTHAATATAPTIKLLDPNSGPAAGGPNVLILGSGFIGTTDVTFGANPSVNFTVDSNSQITAPLPAGTAGEKVIVTVKGKNGSATASFLYT